jgi:integrase
MQNLLNDAKLRAIVKNPHEREKKHGDGGGLYLLQRPSGAPMWRFKYRYAGTDKKLALGTYPDVSLAEAREARDAARKLVAQGLDPVDVRRVARDAERGPKPGAQTFGAFAQKLLADLAADQAPQTRVKWALHMGYAIARFGERPIGEIVAQDVLDFLGAFQAEGKRATAHSVKQKISAVFRRGMIAKACPGDPTTALAGTLLPVRNVSHPAITNPERFGAMLRTVDGHKGTPSTRAAILFLALTFQRPHMVRFMEWSEIDWEAKRWLVPARDMKGRLEHKRDHVVPLSAPALDILRAMLPFYGDGRFVFPGRSGDAPMSNVTMNKALRDLGIEDHVGHGFRASANTMLKEQLGQKLRAALPAGTVIDLQELIDLQLAHVIGDKTRRAYDRVKFIDIRTTLMDVWGQFIAELRTRAPKVARMELAA